MTTSTLHITTPDGIVDATAHQPSTPGPWPAVLVFMDGVGVRPAIEHIAARLCDNGYYALVPNFFYRAGAYAPFDPKQVWSNDEERKRLGGIMATVQPESTMRDIGIFLDTLKATPNVKADKVGITGYCMGGALAFRAAAAHPDRVAAVAANHAGNVVTDKPDSPHLGAGKVKGRLYFACADNDRSCTPEHRATLAAALEAAHVKHTIELYEGKTHGWCVDDMPVYDKAGAEQHYARMLALFAETLT